MVPEKKEDGKTLAVIGYLFIIGSIIAIIMNNENKNQHTAFHNRQGLGLNICYMFIGYFVSQFDSLQISIAFWVGMGLLFFYGILSASSGTQREVPFVGPFFQRVFESIGK